MLEAVQKPTSSSKLVVNSELIFHGSALVFAHTLLRLRRIRVVPVRVHELTEPLDDAARTDTCTNIGPRTTACW